MVKRVGKGALAGDPQAYFRGIQPKELCRGGVQTEEQRSLPAKSEGFPRRGLRKRDGRVQHLPLATTAKPIYPDRLKEPLVEAKPAEACGIRACNDGIDRHMPALRPTALTGCHERSIAAEAGSRADGALVTLLAGGARTLFAARRPIEPRGARGVGGKAGFAGMRFAATAGGTAERVSAVCPPECSVGKGNNARRKQYCLAGPRHVERGRWRGHWRCGWQHDCPADRRETPSAATRSPDHHRVSLPEWFGYSPAPTPST